MGMSCAALSGQEIGTVCAGARIDGRKSFRDEEPVVGPARGVVAPAVPGLVQVGRAPDLSEPDAEVEMQTMGDHLHGGTRRHRAAPVTAPQDALAVQLRKHGRYPLLTYRNGGDDRAVRVNSERGEVLLFWGAGVRGHDERAKAGRRKDGEYKCDGAKAAAHGVLRCRSAAR